MTVLCTVIAIVAEYDREVRMKDHAPIFQRRSNLIDDAGIGAVTFGPGNVAECHCTDERVAVDKVRDAASMIAQAARKLLL